MSERKSAVGLVESLGTAAYKVPVAQWRVHVTAWDCDVGGLRSMVHGLAMFADAYALAHPDAAYLGDDCVIGENWRVALDNVRALLNADVTGALDCGTVDALCCALLENEGFET